MQRTLLFILILAVIALFIAGFLYLKKDAPGVPMVDQEAPQSPDIEVVATGLEVPWEIAFLPEGELLVTERPGRLVRITQERRVIPVEGVYAAGEGGLLGLALHPKFANNTWIYLYLTTREQDTVTNRVERYQLDGTHLNNRTIILDNIPGAQYHDGGRIAFGPDNYLYITTGDAGNENSAQDTNSLAGKILRIKDDGSIPEDNPFGNAVYSYGHRNPQGLAWDSAGRLWATEHGRSGVLSGYDELNLIEKGKNYGWPEIQGDETQDGMVKPVLHSGASNTWAPAGAAFYNGSIWFAGLRGAALYEVKISGNTVLGLYAHLSETYGRLRAVQLGPDGYLYVSTSNRDGRGDPQPGDDKILKIGL